MPGLRSKQKSQMVNQVAKMLADKKRPKRKATLYGGKR